MTQTQLQHHPANMATEKSFSLLLSLLVMVMFNSLSGKCNAEAAPSKTQEVEALLKWKGSLLQNQALQSWSLSSGNGSPCDWTGITCNGRGKVTTINLSNCSLQGKLDEFSFSSLSNLVHLDLSHNALHGNIPNQIGAAFQLVFLDLSINQLSELAYTMWVTEKCDVYSFGVVSLEVIMGMHSGELVSSLLTSRGEEIRLKDVFDQNLPQPNDEEMKEVVLTMVLALACLSADPQC